LHRSSPPTPSCTVPPAMGVSSPCAPKSARTGSGSRWRTPEARGTTGCATTAARTAWMSWPRSRARGNGASTGTSAGARPGLLWPGELRSGRPSSARRRLACLLLPRRPPAVVCLVGQEARPMAGRGRRPRFRPLRRKQRRGHRNGLHHGARLRGGSTPYGSAWSGTQFTQIYPSLTSCFAGQLPRCQSKGSNAFKTHIVLGEFRTCLRCHVARYLPGRLVVFS